MSYYRDIDTGANMNFGYWITYNSKEGYYNIAQIQLSEARQRLIDNLDDKEYSESDNEALQQYLNGMLKSANSTDTNDQSAAQQYIHAVVTMFNQAFSGKNQQLSEEHFSLNQNMYYNNSASTKTAIDNVGKVMREDESRQNMRLSTIQKRLEKIQELEKKVVGSKTSEAAHKTLALIYTNCYQVMQTYFEIFDDQITSGEMVTDYATQKAFSGLQNYLISKHAGSWDNKEELRKELQEFDSLYQTLTAASVISQKGIGAVWEFFLAAASIDLNTFSSMKAEELLKYFKDNNILTGEKQVQRGIEGAYLSINPTVYETLSEGQELSFLNKTINEKSNKASYKFKWGKFDFDYQANINAQGSSSAKMDVSFENSQVASGKRFKISAKNWYSAEEGGNSLNSTTLFRALSRSCGYGTTELFQYSIQQTKEASKIYNTAHRLARAAILLDVAKGESQGAYSASTLVILSRKDNQVYVIDLAKTIKKTLDGTSSSDNLYLIDDYSEKKEKEINESANELRDYIFANFKKQRSRIYESLTANYLNSLIMNVKLTQLTNSF